MAKKKLKYLDSEGKVKLTGKNKEGFSSREIREIILSSTEVRLSKTKKGKRGVQVFDAITGKRLSITKFRKYLGIDRGMYDYLKSKAFENELTNFEGETGSKIRAFLSDIIRTREFEQRVKVEYLTAYTKGYKRVYWAFEDITDKQDAKVLEYLSSFKEKPFLNMVTLFYSGDEIYVENPDKVVKWVNTTFAAGKTNKKSFSDKYGNFVLMSS